jgi:hypothetical protein
MLCARGWRDHRQRLPRQLDPIRNWPRWHAITAMVKRGGMIGPFCNTCR